MTAAMPESTQPEPLHSALITVDLQNDFVLPGAPLETPCTTVLPAAARIVRLFRMRGLPIFHAVRLYLPDGSNADLCRRDAVAAGKPFLLPGSDGARMAAEIRRCELDSDLLLSGRLQTLGENEFALYKPRWSAFFGTNLAEELRRRGVTTVVVVGTWYPNCVHATIYDAAAHDLRTVAVRDAIAGIVDADVPHLERICCTCEGKRAMMVEQRCLLLVLAVCACAAEGLIPAGDFQVVAKYALEATTKGSLFMLAEGVHANYTAHFVLDVRATQDYAQGHVPGAVNVPYAEVFTKDGLAKLPAQQPIAVVCYTGQSAAIVTALLNALGYDAVDMSFGMAAWRKETSMHIWSVQASQTIEGAGYEQQQ